jgi:hypothetical protein
MRSPPLFFYRTTAVDDFQHKTAKAERIFSKQWEYLNDFSIYLNDILLRRPHAPYIIEPS